MYLDVQASVLIGAYVCSQHNTCCTQLKINHNELINLISGHELQMTD